MEGGVCMNGNCTSSNSAEWKKGWPLPASGFATLCSNREYIKMKMWELRTAYSDLVFCETFHSEETGWRECTSCGKYLHCGCIASSTLLELLDTGGVNCTGCNYSFLQPFTHLEEKHKVCDLSTENDTDRNFRRMNANMISRKLDNDLVSPEGIGYKLLLSSNQSRIRSSKNYDMFQQSRSLHKSLVDTNLSIGLSASSNSNTLAGVIAEERQLNTAVSSFQQGCRLCHVLPRVLAILAAGLESNSSSITQLRVARPPVEGRIKSQLLPRYWPRITDQELQQISAESNSTIVLLFEKVLSASDAGRIGRLVLPKACAEAYFPLISQPEGLPLRIQDVKGKEWVFQFRFWPNNNSSMYVLEGITPCNQSMQLQAGDTITFSRMDPKGKLLMGFRKASNNVSIHKDSHYPVDVGDFQGDTLMGNAESLSGYSGLIQSLKGSKSPSMDLFPNHIYPGNINPQITEKNVQNLLRPSPIVKPSTVLVEDHEIEEFDEPPVFGKRSIFIVHFSREHEQFNINDPVRCSCFAPDEMDSWELDYLVRMHKDFTKRRKLTSLKLVHRQESREKIKAQTNGVATGGNLSEPGSSSGDNHKTS
ncbi:B3 domain-containing transcription repressor VAL2-like isoform X2 [Salvia divinorum]|uniref:B3 domain-containing transcription repressor VAL2-like isoform X2 n=1 Tax=Salvia divinorum TaxID=28513 RepID=A0ABD1H1H4_SALDI